MTLVGKNLHWNCIKFYLLNWDKRFAHFLALHDVLTHMNIVKYVIQGKHLFFFKYVSFVIKKIHSFHFEQILNVIPPRFFEICPKFIFHIHSVIEYANPFPSLYIYSICSFYVLHLSKTMWCLSFCSVLSHSV